jgi:hypothetical protein
MIECDALVLYGGSLKDVKKRSEVLMGLPQGVVLTRGNDNGGSDNRFDFATASRY